MSEGTVEFRNCFKMCRWKHRIRRAAWPAGDYVKRVWLTVMYWNAGVGAFVPWATRAVDVMATDWSVL